MDATAHKTHRTEAMRSAVKMDECLRAHGVEDIPRTKQAQIKLHDELCKPDEAAQPQSDSNPEPQPEPATKPRTRTRKPAPKPESKPELKPGLNDSTVPYAPLSKAGRNTVATCPECGKTFVEKFDANGEQTTSNYPAHYESEHRNASKPARRARKAQPKAEPQPEPAKPASRSRKAQPKPEPAKPSRKAAAKPAPKAESNGTSPRERKQELARRLADLAAREFSGASAADKALISYWLHSLPTGTPEGAEAGPWNRYFPKGLPRPQTADWRKP